MAQFHTLEVMDVQKTIRDAIVVTLAPKDGDSDFSFIPGQYLTFRRNFEGEELRRSYSICAGKDEGFLQVGIKRVDGGSFSSWANENLKTGDTLEAMPPLGNFHTPISPKAEKQYLAFAGGSGITPILSIMKSTLVSEPKSKFTLLYANRSVSSIMFREELEDLKNLFMDRFNVVHILEDDAQEIDLFTGRIDEDKCEDLFRRWIDIGSIDMAFICGPEPMMLGISKSLRDHGLPKEQIKFELFGGDQVGRLKQKRSQTKEDQQSSYADLTVNFDGTDRAFRMPMLGQSVLEAAIENDIDAPFACKAGVCATCKAKVLDGEVEMLANHALEDYEVEQGYVLTCQCYPVSDKISIIYE